MGWHRHSSLAVALAWVVLAGCGGGEDREPTVRVSGTLSVEGKPVSKGTIHFQPAKGRPASGIVKDGKFTLTTYDDGDGCIAGKNRLAFDVSEEVPTKDGDTTTKSLIPVKFTDPYKSDVSIEVRPSGYSNLQIDLVGTSVKIKED